MGPKSVLVVKNLPKNSDIWEHITKLPKILEGFRNYQNFVRKGTSAQNIGYNIGHDIGYYIITDNGHNITFIHTKILAIRQI